MNETLAATAFRALLRPTLGPDAAKTFENALLGRPHEGSTDVKTAALLGFARQFDKGAPIESLVQLQLLPAFSEEEALSLVAFAGVVRKYRAVFEPVDSGLTRMFAK